MDDLTQELPTATYTDPDQAERILAAIKELVHAKTRIAAIDDDPDDLHDILNEIDSMIIKLAMLQQETDCDAVLDPEDEPQPPEEEPEEPEVPEEPQEPEVPEEPQEPEVPEEPQEPEDPEEEDPHEPEDEEPEEPQDPEEPTLPDPDPTPVGTIRYAPMRPTIKGTIDIACVSINWTDKKGPTLAQMQTVGKTIASTYSELSNGAIKFNVTAKVVDVNLPHKAAQLDAAEAKVKEVVNKGRAKPFDMYAIVHSDVRNYSNANGGVAHLRGTLGRTALHEVGHLKPFKLEHTGRTIPDTGVYDQYGDCSSFMSSCSTSKLNAPQLWFLGWLPKNKVAQYELTDPTMVYNLEPIDSKKDTDAVKAIRIINKNEELFLSLFNQEANLNALTLQTRVNGGTKRTIPLFGNKGEYGGLIFERVAVKGDITTVRISQKTTTTPTTSAKK